MKKATEGSTPTEHASNIDASIVLRTDVKLCENDLSEQAKEQFSNHTEVLRANQFNSGYILADNRLSPVGRHLFCLMLEQNYTNYKNVLNYVAAHPKIKPTAQLIRGPLILCGIPRTGTTLLYNLLACDPACRAPLVTDMLQPVPPLARSDTSGQMQRNKVARAENDMFNALGLADCERDICASHPFYEINEDLHIVAHTGVNWIHYLLASHKDHELAKWWLNEADKDFVYEYHKTFLHMLSSVDAPRSHWLLKTPFHALHLNTLMRYYPTASLIMTHRRLDETLPSNARMAIAYTSAYFDSDKGDINTSRKTAVELMLQLVDVSIRRLVEFRRANQNTRVLDIDYDDLIAQPIDTVRRVYAYFELAWPENFETAMLAWVRDNPQGKQGRNAYTLEEFGLEREEIEKRYEEYNSMFFKARDKQDKDNDTMKS